MFALVLGASENSCNARVHVPGTLISIDNEIFLMGLYFIKKITYFQVHIHVLYDTVYVVHECMSCMYVCTLVI